MTISYAIHSGPSRMDLMLSLFDYPSNGPRIVQFTLTKSKLPFESLVESVLHDEFYRDAPDDYIAPLVSLARKGKMPEIKSGFGSEVIMNLHVIEAEDILFASGWFRFRGKVLWALGDDMQQVKEVEAVYSVSQRSGFLCDAQ